MLKQYAIRNLGGLGMVGLLTFSLVSCENADKILELEESIESMTESLADVESRLAEEEKSLEKFKELKSVDERYQAALKKLQEVKPELEAAKAKTKEAEASLKTASLKFFNYRNQYRRKIRDLAKGTKIDLSGIKGEEYKDVKISRITPLELRVQLKSGPKGVPYHLLPSEIRERFQFSDEEAEAYKQAVEKLRIARAKANRVVDADKETEQATTELTEVAVTIAEKRSQIASLTRRIKAKQLEAERLESLARGWRTEENNSRGKGRKVPEKSRASKASDEANKVRLGISRAKDMILGLRYEIGQLMKKN